MRFVLWITPLVVLWGWVCWAWVTGWSHGSLFANVAIVGVYATLQATGSYLSRKHPSRFVPLRVLVNVLSAAMVGCALSLLLLHGFGIGVCALAAVVIACVSYRLDTTMPARRPKT